MKTLYPITLCHIGVNIFLFVMSVRIKEYIATSSNLCVFFLQDCYEVVQKTTLVILQRLQHVLQMEVGLNCVIVVSRAGNSFY